MVKRWTLFLFIFLISLFSIQLVTAVGIGPPTIDLTFEPGKTETFDYIVLNTGSSTINVKVTGVGELSDILSFSKDTFKIKAGETQNFKVTVKMPQVINTPGNNIVRVKAIEMAEGQTATVGAVAGVESRISIFVPFEGAFLNAILDLSGVAVGEKVKPSLFLENSGEDNIDSISLKYEVLDGDNVVLSKSFTESGLKKGQSRTVVKELDTESLAASKYQLRITIGYEGKTQVKEADFVIGEELVLLNGLVSNELTGGGIVKLEFKALSKWSEPLDGTAKVKIFKEGLEVDSLESKKFVFNPWEDSVVEVFWDATDKEFGSYVAKIDLSYGDGKVSSGEYNFSLVKKKTFIVPLVIGLFIVAVIIILWLVLWKRRD